MTTKQIAAKLAEIRPGAVWVIRGTTYDAIDWLSDPATKPAPAEIGL